MWFLKSKTVWGGILLAGSRILGAAEITPEVIMQAIGIVVGVFGARDAIRKNGGS